MSSEKSIWESSSPLISSSSNDSSFVEAFTSKKSWENHIFFTFSITISVSAFISLSPLLSFRLTIHVHSLNHRKGWKEEFLFNTLRQYFMIMVTTLYEGFEKNWRCLFIHWYPDILVPGLFCQGWKLSAIISLFYVIKVITCDQIPSVQVSIFIWITDHVTKRMQFKTSVKMSLDGQIFAKSWSIKNHKFIHIFKTFNSFFLRQ